MQAAAGGPRASARRTPRSDAHVALGAALRQARLAAGVSTRSLGYASGHISNVEGGYTTPSRTLLEAYIDLGADRRTISGLYDQVLRFAHVSREASIARRRPAEEPAPGGPPQQVDQRTTPDDVRSYYLLDQVTEEYAFDERGRLRTADIKVRLCAVMPGVRFFFRSMVTSRSSEPGPVDITVIRGGRVERLNTNPLGTTDVYVRLDRDLHPDDPEPFEVAYRINLNETDLAEPVIHFSARNGMREQSVTARFTPPALPRSVWRIEADEPTGVDRVADDAALPLAADGVYRQVFAPVRPGGYYGITWRWPKDLA